MALRIYDAGGTDILANKPAEVTFRIPSGTYAVAVYAEIVEDDLCLPYRLLKATLDWNDGTQPVSFPETNYSTSPLIVNTSRRLGFGAYAITLIVENNRLPIRDSEKITFYVNVEPVQATTEQTKLLLGPILPKDTGLPNRQTWMFDVENDIALLASSVKMLLLTTKGERVMQPTYGTNLRRILFELNIESVESIVQQEISTALAAWEPRVVIQSLGITRYPNERKVEVLASFLARTAAQPFEVQLSFGS